MKRKTLILILSISITLILILVSIGIYQIFSGLPYTYGIYTNPCEEVRVYKSHEASYLINPSELTINVYQGQAVDEDRILLISESTTNSLDEFIVELKDLPVGLNSVEVLSKDNFNREHELVNTSFFSNGCVPKDILLFHSVISLIKDNYPEFNEYEVARFPNSISGYEDEENWYISFESLRSGLSMTNATCFKIEKDGNKFTIVENDKYTYDEKDGSFSVLNPKTCKPLSENDDVDLEDLY